MKKALIFSMILFLASGTTVKAQLEKGRSFISGSNRLELNIGGQKEKSGSDVIEGTETTYFDFDFQPRMGHTIIDNMIVGVFMDFDIYSFKEGLAGVKFNDKWGFIDKEGREVIPFKYDDINPFSEGVALVKINSKKGYIDINGIEYFE